MTQDAIRSKNFITQFPYQTPVALQYDTGDFHALMNHANKLGDVAGFPARKAASAAKGLLRGIGYSSYIEACGLAPSNVAGALGARAGLFECGEVLLITISILGLFILRFLAFSRSIYELIVRVLTS